MKSLLRCLIGVALLVAQGAVSAETVLAGQAVAQRFQEISDWSGESLAELGRVEQVFAVNLDDSPGFSLDFDSGAERVSLLYRMVFNNVAEGWSWDPQIGPESGDYYRYKYLPLFSASVEKSPAVTVELYPGKMSEVRNLWRYDYFLAFDNLYDFYPRQVNDDAGFSASYAATSPPEVERIGMLAVCRLQPPYHEESNTFWKADFAEPVDRTLRKRYFMARLLELRFVDRENGKLLARVTPHR